MDRREAMLRELNLYPLWVRREPVAQDAAAAEEIAPVTYIKTPDSSLDGDDKGAVADEKTGAAGENGSSRRSFCREFTRRFPAG
jgi:hypothetical protein